MIKKIKEHFRTNFTSALTRTLLFFIILIVLLFAVIKFFIIKYTSDNETVSAISSSCDAALNIAENYADSRMISLMAAASDEDVIGWLIDGTAPDKVTDIISGLNARGTSDVWCMRDSDGIFLSEDSSGCTDLGSLNWYGYYAAGGKRGSSVFSDTGIVSGKNTLLTVIPVTDNGNIIGFIGSETSIDDISKYFDRYSFYENCYMVLADKFGSVFYRSVSPDGFPDDSAIADAEALIGEKKDYEVTSGIYVISPETGWEIIILYDTEKAFANRMKMFGDEVFLLLGLLILMLAAVLSAVRYECREIPEISRSIAEISKGNYDYRINSERENEIGLIAGSVDELARTLQEKNALIDDYSNLDMLTGLKNRMKMYEAIDELIASYNENDKNGFALLIIDIDNLRWINEVFGHRYGDGVLKEFAERLKNVFRSIYRFGSDEFVALTKLENGSSTVDNLVKRFCAELDPPIQVFAVNLFVKCSVGISVYPADGDSADILMRNADIALSRAKERGRGKVNYYSSTLRSSIVNKSAISQKLTNALKNNEFYLNYQPIISTADGSIHGFEVLLRWESDELGFVPPSKFVGIAEETGEIVNIGTWIFETSCRFLKKLTEYKSDIILSINVSPVQLEKGNYIEDVRRVLEVTGVAPANIQAEITEGLMLEFMNQKNPVVEQITELGIAIALDDFGTGYSSLSYLKNLPVNCLKVDKSFVDEITRRSKDYAITDSIIDLVHGMGIKTVAEGVETIAQYNSLAAMGCDYIQGFLMSKPMSEAAALDFVRQYDIMYKPDRDLMEKNEKILAAEKNDPT